VEDTLTRPPSVIAKNMVSDFITLIPR
jgi:hypothetical protein